MLVLSGKPIICWSYAQIFVCKPKHWDDYNGWLKPIPKINIAVKLNLKSGLKFRLNEKSYLIGEMIKNSVQIDWFKN